MTAHFHYSPDRESVSAARVRAVEALLIEKGIITAATVDKVLSYFESEMTPLNGAKIVARAWTRPGLRRTAPRRHAYRDRRTRSPSRHGRR
jgi:nitrile hydratase subunit alpha